MKHLYLMLGLIMVQYGCKKVETNPMISAASVTGIEIAQRLTQWSLSQPSPFVIFSRGDTADGLLQEHGDLITNVEYGEYGLAETLVDTLSIDSSVVRDIESRYSSDRLKQWHDSASLSLNEEPMAALLEGYTMKLRPMEFDSLTFALHQKLLEWSGGHYPPQTIRSGYYAFVVEWPNAGGYSGVRFTYRGVQNLEYFTRKVSPKVVQRTIDSIRTTTSDSILRKIMHPIADIVLHDTVWGSE